MRKTVIYMAIAGSAAGMINGLFGAGGGMILVPLLGWLTELKEEEIFPASICIILPICIISLVIHAGGTLPWKDAAPYLIGSMIGGLAAGIWGNRIPVLWLHRGLGLMILWGGVRFLW